MALRIAEVVLGQQSGIPFVCRTKLTECTQCSSSSQLEFRRDTHRRLCRDVVREEICRSQAECISIVSTDAPEPGCDTVAPMAVTLIGLLES
jgi:hypothetical protein